MIRKTDVLPRLGERNAERIRRDMQHRDRAAKAFPLAEAEFATDVNGNTQVTVLSGGTVLYHQLKREPQGWLVVDPQGASTFHRTAQTKTTITLVSSAAAVLAKVLVF